MWTWFAQCVDESFVNCVFGLSGACRNPRHSKGLHLEPEEFAPILRKKGKKERDLLFRENNLFEE